MGSKRRTKGRKRKFGSVSPCTKKKLKLSYESSQSVRVEAKLEAKRMKNIKTHERMAKEKERIYLNRKQQLQFEDGKKQVPKSGIPLYPSKKAKRALVLK